MADRYDDAADRIKKGTGTKRDRDLLQDNWGNKTRFGDVKTQKYQDAVKDYDKTK